MSKFKSNRLRNLTGQEFGMLTALFNDGMNASGHAIWICGCSCGNHEPQAFSSRELVHNGIDSCGCRPRRLRKDGKKYREYTKNAEQDGLYIVVCDRGEKRKRTYLTLSDKTTMTIEAVAKRRHSTVRTINRRIEVYGVHSPMVLVVGSISDETINKLNNLPKPEKPAQEIAPEVTVDLASNKAQEEKKRSWDRKKCRRDGINCTGYSECQSQRCGIGPKFSNPENTDTCYVAPKIIRNLYPSALAAMSHFGVVGC